MKRLITVLGLFICLSFLLAAGIHFTMRGNNIGADYYIYYMAGRAGLVEKVSPYDHSVVFETQVGIIGHPAPDNGDQLAFVYPAFALLPLLPLFFFDFSWSQALWMASNIIITCGLILTVIRKSKIIALSYLLFYPVAFSLILGNLNGMISLIVLFLSIHIFLSPAPSRPMQLLGGGLLAWTVIKPQFIWLFAFFFLFTAWKRKFFSFNLSFIIILSFLFAIATFLWPHWINEWIAAVLKYSAYVNANITIAASLGQVFSPNLNLVMVALAFAVCLVISVFLFRRTIREFEKGNLIATLGWIGYVTYLFHPNGTSYEQLTMLVPFLIWFILSEKNCDLVKFLFWTGGLVLSWAAFYLTSSGIYPRAVYDLSVAFFSIWIIFICKDQLVNFLPRKI